MEDGAKIDEAIKKYLSLWWTDESKKKIISEYGEGLLSNVTEICDYADKSELWLSIDYWDAHKLTIERLRIKYPFLSQTSARKIADMAAYSWK